MLKYTSLLLGMGVALSSFSSVKAMDPMDLMAPKIGPRQARALFKQAPCEIDFDNGHAERMGHLDALQPLLPSGVVDIVKSYIVKLPVLEWFVTKTTRTNQPEHIDETDAVVCEGVSFSLLTYRLERNKVVVGYLSLSPRGVTEGLTNPLLNVDNTRRLLSQKDERAIFEGRLWEVSRCEFRPGQVVTGDASALAVSLVQGNQGPNFMVKTQGRFYDKDGQCIRDIVLTYRQLVFALLVVPAANK